MNVSLIIPCVMLLATLVVAACGGNAAGAQLPDRTPEPKTSAVAIGASSVASARKTVHISIREFRFNPETITIPAGTNVVWANEDEAAHTVTAGDGGWDSSVLLKGQTFAQRFDKAGTYCYYCLPHSHGNPCERGAVAVGKEARAG